MAPMSCRSHDSGPSKTRARQHGDPAGHMVSKKGAAYEPNSFTHRATWQTGAHILSREENG